MKAIKLEGWYFDCFHSDCPIFQFKKPYLPPLLHAGRRDSLLDWIDRWLILTTLSSPSPFHPVSTLNDNWKTTGSGSGKLFPGIEIGYRTFGAGKKRWATLTRNEKDTIRTKEAGIANGYRTGWDYKWASLHKVTLINFVSTKQSLWEPSMTQSQSVIEIPCAQN